MTLQEAIKESPVHAAYQEIDKGDALVIHLSDEKAEGIVQPYLFLYPGYNKNIVSPSLEKIEKLLQGAKKIDPNAWLPCKDIKIDITPPPADG